MNVHLIPPEEVSGLLGRLAGLTLGDIIRRKLCAAEVRAARSILSLTTPGRWPYGETWWMVSNAEWLMKAEAEAEACRAQLDDMGEPHRNWRQTRVLVELGLMPAPPIIDLGAIR